MASLVDELDALLVKYLRTLEALLLVRDELALHSKQAFFSLAKAKHVLGPNHPRPALVNVPLHPRALVSVTESSDGATFSATPVIPPSAKDEANDTDELPASAYADPIRLMAGFPPPSLRDAQRFFRDAAKETLNLASLTSHLRQLEDRIREVRKAIAAGTERGVSSTSST